MRSAAHATIHKVAIWTMDGRTRQAPVWFEELCTGIAPRFLQIRRELHHGRDEWCALCRVPVQPGDLLTFVHCNHVFFPSCFVHTACMDWTNLGGMARHLRDDWQDAQRYAHWF
jgi:hypothetical protein